ncbi:MAG: hypothetical protein ACRDNW_15355 [Trebonia sp.]
MPAPYLNSYPAMRVRAEADLDAARADNQRLARQLADAASAEVPRDGSPTIRAKKTATARPEA